MVECVGGAGDGVSWLSFVSNEPIERGYTRFSGGIGRRGEGRGREPWATDVKVPDAAPGMGGKPTDIRIVILLKQREPAGCRRDIKIKQNTHKSKTKTEKLTERG